MANHFVILAPVSSSDSFSWRVVQSVGSKAWTREIRSRNLVSAAGPEVSSQWQTNSVPTSLEAGLAAIVEGIYARRKRHLEAQAEVVAIVGRSTGDNLWDIRCDSLWDCLWSRGVFYQVRRRERIHPKVQPHCSIFLLHGLQLEGAVADVRPIVRRIFTIRGPSAHKMVVIRRANLEAPRRLETF